MISLCHTCRHVRVIISGRERTFYLCQRHLSERAFAKYPPQPTLVCHGYEQNWEDDSPELKERGQND